MAGSGGGMKWLKYGCLGCLGVIGLFVVGAAILSGVAYLRVRAESVTDRTLTPELPALVPQGATEEPAAPDAGSAEPSPEVTPPPASVTAGHVELDLSGGAFWIEPGRAGEPLRVEARYDENFYALEQHMDEGEDEWSYRLAFRRTGSSLMAALKQMFGGTSPEVRIYLPPDRPIMLDLTLAQGGSEVELGGLWLTTGDIEFSQGGVKLSVDAPLHEPMESLALHGSMGGVDVSRLGNASPRRLTVDYSMGGLNLDLRGRWAADSSISITTHMSGTNVHLPDDVLLEGLDLPSSPAPAPQLEVKPPTLTFTVSGEDIEFH